jgi:hypothetical protein
MESKSSENQKDVAVGTISKESQLEVANFEQPTKKSHVTRGNNKSHKANKNQSSLNSTFAKS